jgi:hypothetical protein
MSGLIDDSQILIPASTLGVTSPVIQSPEHTTECSRESKSEKGK